MRWNKAGAHSHGCTLTLACCALECRCGIPRSHPRAEIATCLLERVATTGEERRHKEGGGVLVTTARLVLTAILLASVAIAIGAGQPCNLAIQSRNHFAVVEMEFRNDVSYLISKCPLLAVAPSRNGTHTFGIAAGG